MKNSKFDDIRPYNEDEIPQAMQRIANCDVFPLLASFVYPDEPIEAVRKRVAAFKTILENNGVAVTVRRTLGSDIDAACGQLRRNR